MVFTLESLVKDRVAPDFRNKDMLSILRPKHLMFSVDGDGAGLRLPNTSPDKLILSFQKS
jgi:hypothetical protein